MKKLNTLVLSIFLLNFSANAQLENVITEIAATGPIGTLPAGYTTYRIYALLNDAQDRVSAVYGSSDPSPDHRLLLGSVESGSAIWNALTGGVSGGDVNCLIWGAFPESEFDSYVSIGATSSPVDNCPDCTGTQEQLFMYTSPPNLIGGSFNISGINTFSLNPDLLVWDGTYLLETETSCNGFGQGNDFRVLLAQLTVPTGTLEFCLNILVLDDGDINSPIAYCHNLDDAPGIFSKVQEVDGSDKGLCFSGEIYVQENLGNGPFNFSVLPNPMSSTSQLFMSNGSGIKSLNLYSTTGQCALSESFTSNNMELSRGDLESGLYIIRITDSSGHSAMQKLLVE